MNVQSPAIPVVAVPPKPYVGLDVNGYAEGSSYLIRPAGELDRATSGKVVVTSMAGHAAALVIDLQDLTFMDSSGYESLLECRRVAEKVGQTFTIRGQTGEPARFLELVAKLDTIESASSPADHDVDPLQVASPLLTPTRAATIGAIRPGEDPGTRRRA